jgi:hypothetical protein
MSRWISVFALLFWTTWSSASEAAESRIQDRLLIKQDHFFLTGGPMLLDRADYWVSPGLSGTATWFWTEDDGIELRLGAFASWPSGAANEVMEHTGFALDAPAPSGLALAGWRHSFGYGKVKLGSGVIHFDVMGALHGGVLFTRNGPAPAASVAPGLLLRLTPSFFASAEFAAFASIERRQTGAFSLGFLPTLSMGVEL